MLRDHFKAEYHLIFEYWLNKPALCRLKARGLLYLFDCPYLVFSVSITFMQGYKVLGHPSSGGVSKLSKLTLLLPGLALTVTRRKGRR